MRSMRRANPLPHFLGDFMRLLRAVLAGGRRGTRALLRSTRRQPGHLVRVLARLKTRAQARRQEEKENEIP